MPVSPNDDMCLKHFEHDLFYEWAVHNTNNSYYYCPPCLHTFCCGFLSVYLSLSIYSFLPYIGMVTIVMNDYPMLKVRVAILYIIVFFCCCFLILSLFFTIFLFSILQYVLLGELAVFVLFQRE